MRTCSECPRDISSRRADARTCSLRCRVAASRRPELPAELVERDRWVRRTAKKVPLTCTGSVAKSTDPATWTSYAAARNSTAGVGLGFVLDGDGVWCMDLDHVITAAGVTPEAAALIASLPATYTELSPSGDGLHLWFRGRLARNGTHQLGGQRVEAYSTTRYISVTRRRFVGAPMQLAELDL